jgi:tetratricopeptide (TPR) repeat protein
MTQNNLGSALATLGEREPGAAHLQQAVAAYRAALLERTRERVPLDWAATQCGLGNALHDLGERESGTAHLKQAVAAYRAALLEYTRERVPLDWARTLGSLGSALYYLGTRTHDATALCQALGDEASAWQVFSEAAPRYASMAADNAKEVVGAIHHQFQGTAPPCLQTYSAVLKQMGIPN